MTFYEKEINRIRDLCFSNNSQIETVIGTRSYIDHNFDKKLNLDFLSHTRFTSKFHLLRLFKKYYGLTPKQYLIAKRIEESKKHLKRGMTVAETCYATGFETPCSFSTLFKAKTGMAPSVFQKEQLLQSESLTDIRFCAKN